MQSEMPVRAQRSAPALHVIACWLRPGAQICVASAARARSHRDDDGRTSVVHAGGAVGRRQQQHRPQRPQFTKSPLASTTAQRSV